MVQQMPEDGQVAVSTAVTSRTRAILTELEALVEALDNEQLESIAHIIADAERVFVTGSGRSGLAARAVAMRLMHIGKTTYVLNETISPAIVRGDVLLAFSASGRASVLEQARTALTEGAEIVGLSERPNELTALCARHAILPARSVVPSRQYAGSLFEQACLIVGDALCSKVQEILGVPDTRLDARHANMP